MATAGHFITLIGVSAFYITLIDSHFERKLTLFIHTLVPRLNKRVLYYIYKFIHFSQIRQTYSFIPNKYSLNYIVQI